MIRRQIQVRTSVHTAFRTFTERVAEWWPPDHLPHGSAMLDVTFETRLGGRLTLQTPEGAFVLGRITHWEPPSRLVYDFYVGSSEAEPSSVDVRFSAEGSGTSVVIEHHQAAVPSERWQRSAPGYARAWAELLHSYVTLFEENA
ncbi:MAG: SRPBCC domain-containing protein [Myxococcales bacterium]|nr:SRPBCC domain-containing protein [Myxococcales bacterium]